MSKIWFELAAHAKLIGILIVIAYFILMFGNGQISLTHPDEVFYSQTAKEMIQHNSWMTPLIFDKPQFEKPIFFYWLLALGFKFFGVTPFVARFWPAFFGILGVGITYWIAWMLFRNKRLAFLSSLVLTSSCIYLALSRAVLTDMVFSIWVTISLGFFIQSYWQPRFKESGLIWFFVISGISVLTKGALGIVFPWLIILSFLMYRNDLGFLKSRATLIGLVLFLLIAVPWHALMFQLYGMDFWHEYWKNVHVRRILEAEHQKSNTWYFYLTTVIGGVLPWTFFLIAAFGSFWKELKSKAANFSALMFLAFWMFWVYVTVQSAQSKLASYIFPIFPAVAIIVGCYLERGLTQLESNQEFKSFKISSQIVAFLFLILSVGAVASGYIFKDYVSHPAPNFLFAFLLLLCSLGIFKFLKQREYLKIVFINVFFMFALLTFFFLSKDNAEVWVSCKDISDELKKVDASNEPVLASKFFVRGVRFFTDKPMAVIDINGEGFFSPHPIPFLSKESEVLSFFKQRKETFCVVKHSNVDDIKRIADGQPLKVEDLGGVGGKFILKVTRLD